MSPVGKASSAVTRSTGAPLPNARMDLIARITLRELIAIASSIGLETFAKLTVSA